MSQQQVKLLPENVWKLMELFHETQGCGFQDCNVQRHHLQGLLTLFCSVPHQEKVGLWGSCFYTLEAQPVLPYFHPWSSLSFAALSTSINHPVAKGLCQAE